MKIENCPSCNKPGVQNFVNLVHCSDTVNCCLQVESEPLAGRIGDEANHALIMWNRFSKRVHRLEESYDEASMIGCE